MVKFGPLDVGVCRRRRCSAVRTPTTTAERNRQLPRLHMNHGGHLPHKEDRPSSTPCPNRRHAARAQARCRGAPPIYHPRTPPRRAHPNVTGDLSRATPQFAVREGREPSQPSHGHSHLPHQTTLIRPRCQPLKPRQPPNPPGIAARAELIGAPQSSLAKISTGLAHGELRRFFY